MDDDYKPKMTGFNWAPFPMSYYLRVEKDASEWRYVACYDQALFNLLYVIHLDCDLKHKGHMAFDEDVADKTGDLIDPDLRDALYQQPAIFMRYARKIGLAGEFRANGMAAQWTLVEKNWQRVQDELVPPASNVRLFMRRVAA